jgi:hypothetical protein
MASCQAVIAVFPPIVHKRISFSDAYALRGKRK